jgi:hypothetical protein
MVAHVFSRFARMRSVCGVFALRFAPAALPKPLQDGKRKSGVRVRIPRLFGQTAMVTKGR